jgi:hypothetical protein
MKTRPTTKNTKGRFGVAATQVGALTLALVAAPAVGAAAYGASSAFGWDNSPCVVASLVEEPSIFSTRGNCDGVDLPTSGSEPTPTPSGGSTPTSEPSTPSVSRESITNVALYSTDTRKIILLNNGGFLEVINNSKVFVTPSRGAAAGEIVGWPTSFTAYGTRIDANVSPNGQTIVVYNGRYATVSFDGGVTWAPQMLAKWYDAEHQYVTSDVSADGKVVMLSVGRTGGGGFYTWLNADSGRQNSDWKSTSAMYDQYSLDISGDGSTMSASLYNWVFPKQTMINLNGPDGWPTTTSVNLSGHTWFRDFAASSNFQEQLRAMRDGSAETPSYLFTSSDGGVTMTKKMIGQFWSLGVSDNGVIQSALRTHAPDSETGQLYMSFDSGENWKKMDVLDGATLGGAELAPDGKTVKLTTADAKTYFATVNP